jgi:hypothetical protein
MKPDHTFEYFIYMDIGGGSVVKGNWKQISQDSIILNTFDQPQNPSTTYTGLINPNRNNIRIKISDMEMPLAFAFITVNENHFGLAANMDGIVELKAEGIQSITYHYLGQLETIKIDNPNYNEIEITVRDLDLNEVPRYLTNKVMTIQNRKLFFNEGYFLQKTNLKNKQWK